jgi:hypothetical protein
LIAQLREISELIGQKNYARALALTAQISDEKLKKKLQFSCLLNLERYEEAQKIELAEEEDTFHFPYGWSLVEGSVSGTGSNNPIEVVDASEIYICVAGVRRVKIDTDTLTITAAAFEALGEISPEDAPVHGPAYCGASTTYLQVYDPVIGRWRSFLTVNSSGTLSARWISQSIS